MRSQRARQDRRADRARHDVGQHPLEPLPDLRGWLRAQQRGAMQSGHISRLGLRAARIAESDLVEHCARKLARFKRPREYRFMDELPKGNTGKVSRKTLRSQLAAG